jgi:hypothetical protein
MFNRVDGVHIRVRLEEDGLSMLMMTACAGRGRRISSRLKMAGLPNSEGRALVGLATSVGLNARGTEDHAARPRKDSHVHIGPIDHIWVCKK